MRDYYKCLFFNGSCNALMEISLHAPVHFHHYWNSDGKRERKNKFISFIQTDLPISLFNVQISIGNNRIWLHTSTDYIYVFISDPHFIRQMIVLSFSFCTIFFFRFPCGWVAVRFFRTLRASPITSRVRDDWRKLLQRDSKFDHQ